METVQRNLPDRIPALIRDLSRNSTDIRPAAAYTFVRIGTAAAEPLMAALSGPDSIVQLRAAQAPGNIGYAHPVHRPIGILRNVDRGVRMRAAAAPGKLCAREVTAHLLMQLRDENPDVCKHAIAAPTRNADPASAGPPW